MTGALRERLRAPLAVATVVWATYLVYTALYFSNPKHDPLDYVFVTNATVSRPDLPPDRQSEAIRPAPGYKYGKDLYDGSAFYMMALDPMKARWYISDANYRYSRIFYPLVARVAAGADFEQTPRVLIGINVLMLGIGTLAVAAYLKRAGASPWLALIYGLSPGLFFSYRRDTCEPLAHGLAAIGVWLYGSKRTDRHWLAAAAFALAGLTRETTLVFAACWALAVLFEGGVEVRRSNARRAALFFAIAAGPAIVWWVFVRVAIPYGLAFNRPFSLYPFGGILAFWPWNRDQLTCVVSVTVPGVVALVASALAIRRRARDPAVLALALHALVFVVFLFRSASEEMAAMSRVTTAVPLCALLALPAMDRALGGRRTWLGASAALWLAPTPFYVLVPMARMLKAL